MQTDKDNLEYLSRRLTGRDQDMRLGHRGVEQLTMLLQEAVAQGRKNGHGQDTEPDSSPSYSRDDLETVVPPEMLAEFRMLATGYLLHIPRLLAALEEFESMLKAGDCSTSIGPASATPPPR